MSKYKVFKVEYTVKTTYSIEIDLASSKAEAEQLIREAVNANRIGDDEACFERWELGAVKVVDEVTR